jgi:hypothetical protein
MDLRGYYQKIREVESKIADVFAVIISLETPDGGRAGTQTEVTRSLAAKMIVNGLAKLAEAEEKPTGQRPRTASPQTKS